MIVQILAKEILADCSQNRQSAKINSCQNFWPYGIYILAEVAMAIRW